MFEKTRIKLTAWYLLIIMSISLLFSLIIFSMVNVEFVRFERNQLRIQEDMRSFFDPGPKRNRRIAFEDIHEARMRLATNLALMNLGIFIFAGGAGYFLAGRTLKPIKEAMDEQGRFISDSSHELRTPLTSLRSEIEVNLMNRNLTSTKARKILKSNLEEVIRLQLLSDRLLELSKSGEYASKNYFKEIYINEILTSAIKKTNQQAVAKQIKISIKIKKTKLTGDYEKLVEVFVILIDNAIKYSSKKSEIKIYSKESKSDMKVFIQDHGIGISDKDLPYIFNRFYRASKSRSEEGYGLGLSIAKKIIESHNGYIRVESNEKGSTFIVNLPT